MFYCVYIGNSKVSNTALYVHFGVKQASRTQEERSSLAIQNCYLSADSVIHCYLSNSEREIKLTDSQ